MGSTRIDLTGHRFGSLTVVKYAYTDGKRAVWRCECDCGRHTEVRVSSLRNGNTKSCGCGMSGGRESIARQIKDLESRLLFLRRRLMELTRSN